MVNNWEFAKYLDQFKIRMIDPQLKRVNDAKVIMHNPSYPWKSEEDRIAGQARYDNYKALLAYYEDFHEKGMALVDQHEKVVNHLAKWYDDWYKNISNNGKQETELMEMQADMLQEIFVEIYKALKPLNLNINEPKALNL